MMRQKAELTFGEILKNESLDYYEKLISRDKSIAQTTCPALIELYHYGKAALFFASNFLENSLNPECVFRIDSLPNDNFIRNYAILKTILDHISKIWIYGGGQDCLYGNGTRPKPTLPEIDGGEEDYIPMRPKLWPQNPGIYFLDIVGKNALDVVLEFSCELYGTISEEAEYIFKNDSGEDLTSDEIWEKILLLIAEPANKTDPFFIKWKKKAMYRIKQQFTRPEWSASEIIRDSEIIRAKLDHEYCEAFKLWESERQQDNGNEQEVGTESNRGNNISLSIKLTDTESNLLEALGEEIMTGPELLKKAGYDYSSNFRSILSNLFKRGILEKTGNGYKRSKLT
jgi:hypothetical protein